MADSSLDVGKTPRSRPDGVDPKGLSSVPKRGRRDVRHRRRIGWRSRDVVRAAGLVLAMYLALRLIWFANALFLVTFLGVLFAIAVSAGVDRLERLRIPRGVGAAMIVLSFFALLGGFGAWLAPTLRSQGAELRQKLPEAVDRVEQWVNKRQSGMFGILLGGTDAVARRGGTTTAADTTPPQGGAAASDTARPGTAGEPPAPQPGGAPRLNQRIQEKLSGASRYLFPFLTHTVEALGGILIVVFLSIYLAADPQLYRRGVLALIPDRRRAQGALVMDRVADVLRRWLVTQLIAMVVIGAVSTTVLLILDVKAAFALGVLAGLFEFIPTVGPLLSAIPAVAMAFLDSPEKAAMVAVAYWGIQFLENHILIPLLMKGGMDLPPALTVVTQALLALVFGFLGLMVAVPLLATAMVMVQVLYVEQRNVGAPAGAPSPSGGFDPDLDEALEGAAVR
ncbi:MAG TPA: AI-2E family transporter [Gemmatimonadaceae bacterium]|nr:AI-2E family transporter [Gemmatimonadaceae bacterium]